MIRLYVNPYKNFEPKTCYNCVYHVKHNNACRKFVNLTPTKSVYLSSDIVRLSEDLCSYDAKYHQTFYDKYYSPIFLIDNLNK